MATRQRKVAYIARERCGCCWNPRERLINKADGSPDEDFPPCPVCNNGGGKKKNKTEIFAAGGNYRGLTNAKQSKMSEVEFNDFEFVTRTVNVSNPKP